MVAAKDGVRDTAAVELTRREQIERRHEESGPRRVGDRVREEHVTVRNLAEARLREKARQQRIAEARIPARRYGHNSGPGESDEHRWHGDRQAGERTRGGDVEE